MPPILALGALVWLGIRGLLTADPARLPSPAARPKLWKLGSWRMPLGSALILIVGNAAALPLYSLIWRGTGRR